MLLLRRFTKKVEDSIATLAIALATFALGAALQWVFSWRFGERARRLRTFEQIARAKREWEGVFDALGEGVMVVDSDNTLRRVNVGFARTLGAHPRDLVGRKLEELFAGHPAEWTGVASYVEIEDPVFKTVFELTRVRQGPQQIVLARDVGERRRLIAQLMQSDKLATVGVLAAGVAHEINNPAAYVMTNLREVTRYLGSYERALSELKPLVPEAALKGISDRWELDFLSSDAPALAAECAEGMERIRTIVGTLQSICRRDLPEAAAAPMRLDDVVKAVARTAASHLRSWGGHLNVPAMEPFTVLGHRGQLAQVVLNLVVNAIQAKDGERPNHVSIHLEQRDRTVTLRITDTGKGVTEEQLARLFEPFFTTKPEGLGTGLGLHISREIVVAHGGTIRVDSVVGRGTEVEVTLPACDEELSPLTLMPPSPEAQPQLGRLKLLIVDDEPNLLRALERSLARDHYVRVALDGEAAFQEIMSNQYDVVLCDLSMPRLDGFELHRRVARADEARAKRFLFFTGQPITEILAKRLTESGVGMIPKPLDVKELNLRLNTLSEGAEA